MAPARTPVHGRPLGDNETRPALPAPEAIGAKGDDAICAPRAQPAGSVKAVPGSKHRATVAGIATVPYQNAPPAPPSAFGYNGGMWDALLDPETLKLGAGIAAMIYGAATVALLIAVVVTKTPSVRNDSRIVAPILAIVAISLALIDVEFPRADETLLPILYLSVVLTLSVAGIALVVLAISVLKYPATRIAALVAAPLPMATCAVLMLIAYMLAHSRFCC